MTAIPPSWEAPHLYAKYVLTEYQACRWCHRLCVWGYTTKERRALFNPETRLNHWLECPERERVKRFYDRKRRRVRA